MSVKSQAKPEQTLAQFQAILASALDPIVTIDAAGTIQSASDSVKRVFGWTPDEIVGQNVKVLIPEPHRSRHDAYLAEYRRTERTNILGRTREFLAVRKDGSEFPIELSVSRVDMPDAEEPWFMGIIHDATERRRTEAELEQHRAHLEEMVRQRTAQLEASNEQLRQADRLASIGTLAAGLGHDMNNVLLPIRARLDALDADQLPPHSREQFQAVRRSVHYLQQLSDGLHLMALDPQDAEASSGETDIQEWWNQVGALLSKAVPKRIAFNVEIDAGLPPIALPPHRLTQSILNLLVNAGEAILGEGCVRLWARRGDRSDSVIVGVTDTGEGMAPEVRKHAFDPFFTTKKRGLGTGLGLSLVHGVAQSAGGTVRIESTLGKGTTVVLDLPVQQRGHGRSDTSDDGRVAILTIRDRRAFGMIAAILASRQLIAETADAAGDHRSRLWIVDPALTTREAVNAYLRRGRDRHVVLFGVPADDWSAPRVLAIDDVTDVQTIRLTLGEAIAAIGASA